VWWRWRCCSSSSSQPPPPAAALYRFYDSLRGGLAMRYDAAWRGTTDGSWQDWGETSWHLSGRQATVPFSPTLRSRTQQRARDRQQHNSIDGDVHGPSTVQQEARWWHPATASRAANKRCRALACRSPKSTTPGAAAREPWRPSLAPAAPRPSISPCRPITGVCRRSATEQPTASAASP
jgi:hypothetical protein